MGFLRPDSNEDKYELLKLWETIIKFLSSHPKRINVAYLRDILLAILNISNDSFKTDIKRSMHIKFIKLFQNRTSYLQ